MYIYVYFYVFNTLIIVRYRHALLNLLTASSHTRRLGRPSSSLMQKTSTYAG